MKIAIAGLGYTGKSISAHLKNKLEKENTSDFTQNELFLFSKNTQIEHSTILDFSKEDTDGKEWQSFLNNQYDRALFTFSIHELSEATITKILQQSKQSILFSSTGVFERGDILIHEQTKKDPMHKRYKNESFWLDHGGMIVYLAGIYGPDRNPIDWIVKGKVKNSPRQLNMIHLEDIIQYTNEILFSEKKLPSELILADGQIHTWEDIFKFAEEEGIIRNHAKEPATKENAFCDSSFLQNLFPEISPLHFWTALRSLNK